MEVTSENITQASFTHPSHLAILRKLIPTFKASYLNEPCPTLNGITPLCLASYLGKYKVVLALIEEGKADVDSPDSNGATPLMYAARDGHSNIVQLLLEFGARPDLVDCNAWSSLQYARGFPEITILLEENLRQSRQNVQKNLSLSHHLSGITAVVYPNFLGRLASLLSDLPSPRVATFSESDQCEDKAVEIYVSNRERMEAIKRNDHLRLESLLFSSNGNTSFLADNSINQPDSKSGSTLLHHTARVRPVPSLENIVLLYQAGADINAQTYDGRTVIHHLCRFKRAKSRRPSSLPLPDSNEHKEGKSVTAEEIHGEQIANCADLLIRLGALINIKDRLGNTPIHYAVQAEDRLELVKTLVKAGADLNIRNNNGKTPAECATDYCTRKMLWEVNPPMTKLETNLIPLHGYRVDSGNDISPLEVKDSLLNLKRSSVMTLSVGSNRNNFAESDANLRRWNSTRTIKGNKKHFSLSVISKMLRENGKKQGSVVSQRDSRGSLGVSFPESDRSDASDEELEDPVYVGEGIMSPRAAIQAKQQNRISPRINDYKRASSISLLTRIWKDQNNGEGQKSKRASRTVTIMEEHPNTTPNIRVSSLSSSSSSNPTFIVTNSDQDDKLSIITDASSITSESSEEFTTSTNEKSRSLYVKPIESISSCDVYDVSETVQYPNCRASQVIPLSTSDLKPVYMHDVNSMSISCPDFKTHHSMSQDLSVSFKTEGKSSISEKRSRPNSILHVSDEIEIQFHQVIKDFRTFDSSVSSSIEGTLQLIAEHILLPSPKTLQLAENGSETASPQQHYMINFEKLIRIQDVINYFHPDLEQMSQHLVSIAQQYHIVIDAHRSIIEGYEVEWTSIISAWEQDISKINELESSNQGIRGELESIETEARKLLSELELSREKKLRHLAKELVPDLLEPEQLSLSPILDTTTTPRRRSNSIFSDSPSEIIEKLASKVCNLERELESRNKKDKERELLICEFAKILENNVKEAEFDLIKQCKEKRSNANSRSGSPCESPKSPRSNEKEDSLVQILRRQLDIKDRQIQQLKRANESLKSKLTNGESSPTSSKEDKTGALEETSLSTPPKQSIVDVEPESVSSVEVPAECSRLEVELRYVIGNLKEIEMQIRETDSKLHRVVTSKRWIYHKSLALDQRGLNNAYSSNELSLEDSDTESLPNLMEQANMLCAEHDQIIADRRGLEKEKLSVIRRMNQLRTRIKELLRREITETNETPQKSFSSEISMNNEHQEAYEGVLPQVTESKLSIQSVESLIFSLQITLTHQLRILSSGLTSSRLQIASAKGELPSLVAQAKRFVHELNATKEQLGAIGTTIEMVLANRKLLLRHYGEIGVELNRIVSSAYLHKSQRSSFADNNDHNGVLVPLPKLDEWLQNYQSGHQPSWASSQDIEELGLIYASFWSSLETAREEKSLLQRKYTQIENVLLRERKLLDSSGMESESGLLGISKILNKIRNREELWQSTKTVNTNPTPSVQKKRQGGIIPRSTSNDDFGSIISTQLSASPLRIQSGSQAPLQNFKIPPFNANKLSRSSLFLDLQPAIKKSRSSCPDLRLLVKQSLSTTTAMPDRKYSTPILKTKNGNVKPLRRRAHSIDGSIRPTIPKTTPRRPQTSNNSPILDLSKKKLTPLKGPERRNPVRSVSASPEIRTLRKIASSASLLNRSPGTRSVTNPSALGLNGFSKTENRGGSRTDLLQQKLTILSQLRKEMDILERVNSSATTSTPNNNSQEEEKRRFQAILRKKREYILRLKDLTKECQVALNSSC
ncbi:hypothetical protein K7432_005098 [Basidiobolus ranarum]